MNGDLRQLIRRIKLVLDGKPSRAAVACGRAWSWLLLCTCAALLFCSEGSAQVIRRVSSPGKFYVDDKAGVGVVYNYAVYTISNNTGTTFPGVLVAITNINFVIEALANKVTIITNLNPYAVLGSEVPLVIAGDTGTIGGENSVSFSPAVLGSWRPARYTMVRTFVQFTENPLFTNQIYFDPNVAGFTNFTGQSYTNTFVFRAVKPTITNLAISPFAFVDSGSGTKHTAFSSLASSGGSNVIYSATNIISIASQTAMTNFFYAPGGTTTFSITFSNFAPTNVDLDEIVDQLPSTPGNPTFIPGSATFGGVPLADPTIVGQALHWARPFTMNSFSTSVLPFRAVIPTPAGQYTDSVIALIGPTQIDSTGDTTDNSPSRSVVTVIPVADIAVGKSAPGMTVTTERDGLLS